MYNYTAFVYIGERLFTMNKHILEIKNLTTKFRTENGVLTAIDNVSFDLIRGEITGIVGESGSGKSVTSLSIMQLISRSNGWNEGELLFYKDDARIDLLKLTETEMRSYRGNRIAMIFQEPMTSLNPVLTCGEQIAETIRLHQKTDKETAIIRTIELFKEVQLPRPEQLINAYPHQLSGGQKQRVMIAMALSCNPDILIADEPTTALDVTVQKTILDLLKRIRDERSMTMIFISHDLGVIAEIADQVVVMYKGELVEKGRAEVVFIHPQHPYTRGLLACRPSLQRRLKRLPTVNDFLEKNNSDLVNNNLTVGQVVDRFQLTHTEIDKRKTELRKSPFLLCVKDLNVWFPIQKGIFKKTVNHIKAVNNVSFEVYSGETLGLVGESGCGKTTLGRSILRLIEPTSGEILFGNQNLLSLSTAEMRAMRRNMQIIFQDPYSSLNPRFTVGKSIMEPMQVHQVHANDNDRKNKVIQLLEQVGLKAEHFNRFPHEFSGGQRQRVCIARALSLNPKFIICDESVSALDVSVQAQVLNLLAELRESLNLTYIFISHDLSVVKHISDRMIVMSEGQIVEAGDPDEIYHNPKQEYTQKLINAIPKGNPFNTF